MSEHEDVEVRMSLSACFTRAQCLERSGCDINRSTAIIASIALEELGLQDGEHCDGTLSCDGSLRNMTEPELQKAEYLGTSADEPICNLRLTLFVNMNSDNR
jgi:hypothetical protein